MLTATCSTNEAQKIRSIMNIEVGDLNIIQGSSFIRSEITFEVQTKVLRIGQLMKFVSKFRKLEMNIVLYIVLCQQVAKKY